VRGRDAHHPIIVAIAHRWEPGRLFVILTCYLDESGTHGGSPVTVMAGAMATANQWRQHQRRVDSIKATYGFKIFHTKKWKSPSGEFAGWSEAKRLAMFRELGGAGARLMEAVTCVLPNDVFDANYGRSGDDSRKLRLDTKYGLCFRYTLTHLTAEAVRRLGTHKKFSQTSLNVVLESGHKNAGDAERIFFEVKKEIEAVGCHLLGTITFADKDDCDPLWIADALSHGEFAMYGAQGREPPDPQPVHPSKATGMMNLRFTPDGLANMKARLVGELAAKRGATLLLASRLRRLLDNLLERALKVFGLFASLDFARRLDETL